MNRTTLVVGIDGSENGQSALETAADLVADGGTVHVVTAFDPPAARATAEVLDALPDEYKAGYDQMAVPHALLGDAEAFLERRGVAVKTHLVRESPSSGILDVAEQVGADLVVVGSRGLGPTTRFLRGSVSTRIATHAECSVLIVHHQ